MTRADLRWVAKKAARRAVTGFALPSRAARDASMRALTYHRFQTRRRDAFALPAAEFEAQVATIAASKRFVALDELHAFLAGTAMPGPDRLLLTIDDGYVSTIETAAPILRRYGVPAVAFITTGRIGTRGDGPERFLDRDEVGSLAAFGIAVGSHATRHRSLGGPLDDETLASEITGSRHVLEDLLGRPVAAFAYPYGTRADHSPRTRAVIDAAGYRAAFTSRHGRVTATSDPLVLPRIKIESGDPPVVFSRALTGGLDGWRLVDDLFDRLQASGRG